jgi:hypothetical protein
MNEIKCGDCAHFHVQKRGSPKGLEEIKSYALCGAKSVYHANNPDLPEGSQTTTEPVAKPVVVTREMLVTHCDVARRA